MAMKAEPREAITQGSKQKKGKEAEALLHSILPMLQKAKDTADGFNMQQFDIGKAIKAATAEVESPEKSGGLGWDAASEAQLDLDLDGDDTKSAAAGDAQGGSSKDGKKTRARDVARLRVSSYEKQRKAVSAIEKEAESTLKTSAECFAKYKTRTEFAHFLEILHVRQTLLKAFLEEDAASFEKRVNELDEKTLSLQPVPKEVLLKTSVMKDLKSLLENILLQNEKEALESACRSLSDQCAIHIQLRNSLKNSARDLEGAVKSEEKKKEREEAAQAKREAQKKQTADAQSAAATRKAAAKDTDRGVTILSTFSDKLRFTWFQRFPDLSKFKARIGAGAQRIAAAAAGESEAMANNLQITQALASGAVPFVISSLADVAKLVSESPSLRCQVTNFSHQFPGTQLCRTSGRAQCPAKVDESTKQLVDLMLEAAPFRKDASVIDSAPYADLKSILRVALFGFTPEMSYVGFEERGLGQLRYLVQGSRKVIMASPRTIQDRLNVTAASVQEIMQIWKYIDLSKLSDCNFMYAGVQKAGSLMYCPPGWLIAEEALNGDRVVGFRVAVIPDRTESCVADFNAFLKLIPAGHAYEKLAKLAQKCLTQDADADA